MENSKHLCQLLEISIRNYRSFYDKQTISLSSNGMNANPITILLGANASGKSNSAKALVSMFSYITTSLRPDFIPPYNPFAFYEKALTEPTTFEIIFRHDKNYYIYGFSYDATQIVEEYLREKSDSSKYHVIFHREQKSELNSRAINYGFGKKLLSETRKETLLITKAREENNKYSNIVFDLVRSVACLMGTPQDLKSIAIGIIQNNPTIKESIKAYLKKADFSVTDFFIRHAIIPEEAIKQMPLSEELRDGFRKNGIWSIGTAHYVRNDEKSVINQTILDIDDESTGTQEFFYVMTLIIDTIQKGNTLFIDEFASSLHPDLAMAILGIFKDDKHGKLVINTHVQQLLSASVAANSPERVMLVEKDHILGNTKIVSLTSRIKRTDEVIEKRYRNKLYGGVPDLQDFLQEVE